MLPDRVHNGDLTEIGLVFRRKLAFLAPVLAQTALRIDAEAVKFRRKNSFSLWLVWLDFLYVASQRIGTKFCYRLIVAAYAAQSIAGTVPSDCNLDSNLNRK
jgi:hypothetical protein